MRRRQLIGVAAATALAGCSTLDPAAELVRDAQEQLDELSSDGPDGVIERIETIENEQRLVVTFQEEHESDFLALVHETDDETILWRDSAPRFAGPIEVPFMKAVSCDDADYPTTTFELVAGTGTTSLGLVEEVTARQPIEVDDRWLDRAAELEMDQAECMALQEGYEVDTD